MNLLSETLRKMEEYGKTFKGVAQVVVSLLLKAR